MSKRKRSGLRNWVEFIPAWLLLRLLGTLPRRRAISAGQALARAIYHVHGRLRRAGDRNLSMAMPDLSPEDRRAIIEGVFRGLGRLLGEFSQFPKIDSRNISEVVEYDGFEHYERAALQGRGVLLLTGHVGAWELCAFAHGAYGHPLSFLVRPLDNPMLNRLITRYRELSGNRTIDKSRAVRPVLNTLKSGGEVGLLVDVNTFEDQGVFCDFFGIPACSTTGLAVFALRSGAPVVPGFLLWDEMTKRHRLSFGPEVPVVRTGDFKEEVRINTARFTGVIEECIRRHPDQWLWIHKRWHTRPAGEPDLYGPVQPETPGPASAKIEAQA
ncbi:MAG TPA: lysophospholipid acyltransferase family protein [Blastocatellia bacterium]|nr:lysophospholipid acyltransferase family protein [Blastocatellia bacterium]